MQHHFLTFLLIYVTTIQNAYNQTSSISSEDFFNDTSVFNVTLTTNTSRIFYNRSQAGNQFPAILMASFPDGTQINDSILLEVRGHYRLSHCTMPPIKIIFNARASSKLYLLRSLKLVSQCRFTKIYEQYLLKEYIVYKIFNVLSEKSFKVMLLNLTLRDSTNRKKPITERAFLVEDISDVAKRNNCVEWKKGKINSESTDRQQTTLVAIFEYMIGNTDFAVSVNHNIRLIVSARDSLTKPFEVPFDFDYSGIVDAEYAIPDERLDLENIRQRAYRGFPRTKTELEEVLNIFKSRKTKIYDQIRGFDLLTPGSKREMTDYLDEFYEIINKPVQVKRIFIDNAIKK